MNTIITLLESVAQNLTKLAGIKGPIENHNANLLLIEETSLSLQHSAHESIRIWKVIAAESCN
ncbi:MAG: hypothetical protein FWD27_07295, partial [Coriobacteriia bacterium]|nr:hypothetical protein [Coriobacteriia bacterium]